MSDALSLRQRLLLRRTALRARAFDRAAHALIGLRYALPDADPARFGIEVVRDVPYADQDRRPHRLDVYLPRRVRPPWPVVMYVHGGGFGMLSKDTHRVMAMAFARRGYLVFNINYRLGLRNAYPAPLEDASRALLWVNANARRYGGDLGRFVLAGESAGGNLVTALTLAASTPLHPAPAIVQKVYDAKIRVRAVVCTYPFADLHDIDALLASPRLSPWVKGLVFDAACSYVGPHVFRVARAEPLASPLRLLESGLRPERPLPPFFVSVGTKDPLLDQSRRLARALERLGVPCELLVAPGEIHGYDALVWRPAARAKWAAAHAFLTRHLEGDAPADAVVAPDDAAAATRAC